jgi:dihydrofolate synthase/folylpolyglutamate synthase
MNTIQESLEYLYQRLPMYQRVGQKAYKKDLTNTIKLLDHLDNPQDHFRSVHIAGTNGKGTSAHAIASVLQSSGYKVGLYTSPHLKRFNERIRINGSEISDDWVVDFVNKIKPVVEDVEPSFFEVTVAMAFDYFGKKQVDIAVIETGLGGRLDSTNVISPLVSLITNIGWDHMDMLGDTLEKIAAEKAGIIKSHTPVVIGTKQPELHHVFEDKARDLNANINYAFHEYHVIDHGIIEGQRTFTLMNNDQPMKIKTDLVSTYFLNNIPGIMGVLQVLNKCGYSISTNAIHGGFSNISANTGLKGRYQVIGHGPKIIADVSHNQDGLALLIEQVQTECKGALRIVFGTVRDKDLSQILELLPEEGIYYLCQSKVPRAMPIEDLVACFTEKKLTFKAFNNVNEARLAALKDSEKEDLILITGSTFVVAELEDL